MTLLADLPGVSKERLHVRVERDTLIVEGDIEIALPEQCRRFTRTYAPAITNGALR